MKTNQVRKTSQGQTSFLRADLADDLTIANDNIITFPLSSEEPYRRWYWDHGCELDEILSHKPSAVDLTWFKSGNAPLLDTHSRHGLGNVIGVIIGAELKSGRVYVTARLSNAEDDASTVQKIIDGIIRNVSIGYEITKFEVDEKAGTYTATRWKPTEASFVPLPADPTVGVGRTAEIGVNMTTAPKATPGGLMPGLGDTRSDEERAEELTTATNEITALAKQHNEQGMARSFIKGHIERGTVPNLAMFKGLVAANLPEGTPLVNTEIGLTETQRDSFSLLNVARALADPHYKGAEFEMEAINVATEGAKERNGHNPVGQMIPTDVLNSWGRFTVDGHSYRATSGSLISDSWQRMGLRAPVSAGVVGGNTGNPNVLTTDHMADRFIDNLRNQSSILRAGVTTLEGLSSNIEIPGGDQNISAAWLGSEDANAAESVPTFRKVTMQPHDVAAFTDLTRRMLQQATIAIEAYVRMQLLEAHRIAIDHAGVYGTGATGIPTGIVNTTGIGSVPFTTAGQPTRDEMIDIETTVDLTNRAGDVTHLLNSTMRGQLRKTPVVTGAPVAKFLWDEFGDASIKSNQVLPGDVVSGVWQDMLMGTWGGLQLDRSTEAKFLSGGIRLRSIQTVDFAVARVGSFVLGR